MEWFVTTDHCAHCVNYYEWLNDAAIEQEDDTAIIDTDGEAAYYLVRSGG